MSELAGPLASWAAWCEPAAAQREDVTHAARIEDQTLLIGVEREGLSFDWRVPSGGEVGIGMIGIQEPGLLLQAFGDWSLEPAEVIAGAMQSSPRGTGS